MDEKQAKHLRKDIVKEIAWTLVLMIVYAVYCSAMVLIFSFVFHAYIDIPLWLLVVMAIVGTVVLTVLHIVKVSKEF